ncbi:MAG TPA: caspase family protein [Longimicrobium sp.]|jgi:hypothetical protein
MPTGLSIHLGVNNPGGENCSGSTLTGSENDARAMQALAGARDFRTALLPPEQTTRRRVWKELATAAHALRSGDILLVTFSGHGTQVRDHDDERDFYDETWCLADGELIDDCLHHAWAKFRAGVRIVVVSDSCKSGTVQMRAWGGNMRLASSALREQRARELAAWDSSFRAADAALAPEIADLVLERRRRSSVRIAANVLLLAACGEGEDAQERGGHGLFTRTLLDIWRGGFDGTYADLIRAVRRGVSGENPRQHPGIALDGTRDRSLLDSRAFTI